MTASTCPLGELVGLRATIRSSTDPGLESVSGTVMLETKNMLVLETARGRKMAAKQACSWEFEGLHAGPLRVDGSEIAGRPQDRLTGGRA